MQPSCGREKRQMKTAEDSSLLPGCHVDLVSIVIPHERSFLSFDTFQHFLWGKLPELRVFFPSAMGLTTPPHRVGPLRGGGRGVSCWPIRTVVDDWSRNGQQVRAHFPSLIKKGDGRRSGAPIICRSQLWSALLGGGEGGNWEFLQVTAGSDCCASPERGGPHRHFPERPSSAVLPGH